MKVRVNKKAETNASETNKKKKKQEKSNNNNNALHDDNWFLPTATASAQTSAKLVCKKSKSASPNA